MEDPGNEKGNLQKFEIGDKVYIRKDCKEIFKYRADYCGEAVCFTLEMQKYCGKVATIIRKDTHYSGRDLYHLDIDVLDRNGSGWSWMAWMLLPIHHRKAKKALKAKVRS